MATNQAQAPKDSVKAVDNSTKSAGDRYVYSTLASDNNYTTYGKAAADGVPPPVVGEVLIKGGTGVIGTNLITPQGACITKVTAEQVAQLEKNPVFAMHKANGYVQISEALGDGENAAADMTGRDRSAQLVPADYEANGQAVPKVAT